ncbi:MAG TPA: pyrimidine reductase family protein [Micromonosporaceae bacterium]|nr:pyrimidine reductase family protein [Micromonosporaceae bacterium]
MTTQSQIRRLWPDPSAPALDDAALADLYSRSQRPHLRANFVSSVDGAVALDGHSAGLSGPADKRVFGVLRMLCDALLVGAGTLRHESYRAVRLDARRRAWRRDNGLPEFPTLVVVSRSLHLDPAQAAFADAPVRPLVLTTAKAVPPPGLTEVAEVLPLPGDEVDPAAALAELHRRGLDQVLCEGGPRLFGALTAADLVDELCLTVSPQLAGAGADRIILGPQGPSHPLRLAHVLAADNVLMLRYVRAAPRPAD